jgi:DNA-directed RNA polymerase specialized sigma24 family protein
VMDFNATRPDTPGPAPEDRSTPTPTNSVGGGPNTTATPTPTTRPLTSEQEEWLRTVVGERWNWLVAVARNCLPESLEMWTEDVVMDALVKVIESFTDQRSGEIDSELDPGPWLAQTIRWTALDRMKSKKSQIPNGTRLGTRSRDVLSADVG